MLKADAIVERWCYGNISLSAEQTEVLPEYTILTNVYVIFVEICAVLKASKAIVGYRLLFILSVKYTNFPTYSIPFKKLIHFPYALNSLLQVLLFILKDYGRSL